MAVRKHLPHDAKTRDKIRTSQLINRLEKFVINEADGTTKEKVELSPAQVTAALGLIKKTLPDISAITLNGPGNDGEHIIAQRIELVGVRPSENG